jgi:serine/threonine protein kinase
MSSVSHRQNAQSALITLAQLLEQRGGRLPEALALRLARGIAERLAELHQRSLLYGHLHPDVIWLAPTAGDGPMEVSLQSCDQARPFGALVACGTLHNLGAVYPTAPAHYMAPEFLSNGAGIDGKADVYSLGALLYHLLGGRAPFEGDTAAALGDAHLLKTPRPIRRRNPEVSVESEELLHRLLSKSPALRPSMAQLVALLPGPTPSPREPVAIADAMTVRAPFIAGARHELAAPRPSPPAQSPRPQRPATEPMPIPQAATPPAQKPLAAGTRCGRYQIVRRLGGGGMAEVFEASHMQTRQRVAIKVPRPELLSRPSFAARFLVEARAMATLQLSGVGEIYDFDQLPDGTPYIVMEYVAGECLRSRLQRCGSLPLKKACEIIRQLAHTMSQAHAAQVIHRDLKPDNVMLVADADLVLGERAKILDFGIAKLSVEMKKTLATSAMTQAGARLGTLAYMAPEQWMDPSTVDGRADVYALGVIAYELLLGRLPFGGAEVMSRMATPQELPPLDFPGIPRGLALLVTQMLALEPAGRPTMAQVAGSIARAGANAALGGRLQPMRVAVFAAGSALPSPAWRRGASCLRLPRLKASQPRSNGP